MYLVILNGEVVSSYSDEPDEIMEGAELVEWDGPSPAYRIIDGMPYLPLDPRDNSGKLLSAKKRKLKEIRDWDNAIRLAGVAIGDYTLRYDDIGQQRVMNLITSIRELVEQGVITGNTLISFETADGDIRKVKASVLRGAVSTYFSACQAQDDAVGALVDLLKAASTIQEVEAIVVRKG